MRGISIETQISSQEYDFKEKIMGLARKSGKMAFSIHIYMFMSTCSNREKLLINLFSHIILNSFQIYVDNVRSQIMKYGFLIDANH